MNKKAKASNRFVGYIRVSTDKQAESGLGLMDQRLLIKEKVERMGGELVAVHDDAGKSGSLPLSKRPGLQAAISMMEPGDTLVVAKRDRLARDMLIVMMIERELSEMGCRVVSASGEGTDEDTPEARLMRHFIDAISEYQRLVTKIRTRNAFAIKRSKGEYCGGEPPFGFRVAKNGVKLEPEPRERATMEQAVAVALIQLTSRIFGRFDAEARHSTQALLIVTLVVRWARL